MSSLAHEVNEDDGVNGDDEVNEDDGLNGMMK